MDVLDCGTREPPISIVQNCGLGLCPPGLPGFLPKTPFSCVPIYLRDIPLIFGHSKPQAQQEKQENEGKRGKGKES